MRSSTTAVHVEGLGQEEAIRMLREEAFQEVSEATQKWRRLTLSQVQLTSYFSGYAEIYDFPRTAQGELGEDFDLQSLPQRIPELRLRPP